MVEPSFQQHQENTGTYQRPQVLEDQQNGQNGTEESRDPYEDRLESITLGTYEVDTFLEILEGVIDPLQSRVREINESLGKDSQGRQRTISGYQTTQVLIQVVRKNALPDMVGWLSGVSGIPKEELDQSILVQSKVLKKVRESGLGDFLGEWLQLVGPMIR